MALGDLLNTNHPAFHEIENAARNYGLSPFVCNVCQKNRPRQFRGSALNITSSFSPGDNTEKDPFHDIYINAEIGGRLFRIAGIIGELPDKETSHLTYENKTSSLPKFIFEHNGALAGFRRDCGSVCGWFVTARML